MLNHHSEITHSYGLMILAESSNCEIICSRDSAWDNKVLWSLFDGKGAGWREWSNAPTFSYPSSVVCYFSCGEFPFAMFYSPYCLQSTSSPSRYIASVLSLSSFLHRFSGLAIEGNQV